MKSRMKVILCYVLLKIWYQQFNIISSNFIYNKWYMKENLWISC